MSGRLNGSLGSVLELNVKFYRNGVPTDPTAIRVIRIYKNGVCDSNLILEIPFPTPDESDTSLDNPTPYNGMVRRCRSDVPDEGPCGTDITGAEKYIPGCFIHDLKLCNSIFSPGCYYDVWGFIGCLDAICTDISSIDWDNEQYWSKQSNRFFVGDCAWYVDAELSSIRIGFEPIDNRFQHPEVRFLEVGLTPLPLYDYDYKRLASIIPNLHATITFMTQYGYCETVIDGEAMQIGLREGSYRSNPYVFRYLLDTKRFLKGTYRYRVDVALPDGQTRSSPLYNVAIR